MRRYGTVVAFVLFLVFLVGLFALSKYWGGGSITEPTFVERCLADGNMWHKMSPLRNGVQEAGEAKNGCMTADGAQHFSDYTEYKAASEPGESDILFTPPALVAEEPVELLFSVRAPDGSVPELYRQHERYLHVVIISRDMTVFSHVHPDDARGFSVEDVKNGELAVPYTFPKAGEYIIALDYANRLKHESRQFRVHVAGSPGQAFQADTYRSPAPFEGFDVTFDYSPQFAGMTSALRFTFRKNGRDVEDLEPYLGAAMHVAIVKNDLSEFIHTHGEWHPPGYVTPQNPSLSHVHAPPPEKFGPTIEAHAVFPSPGLYTVFGEFKQGETVNAAQFSVRIE
jgi:Cu+-exporting ATPase